MAPSLKLSNTSQSKIEIQFFRLSLIFMKYHYFGFHPRSSLNFQSFSKTSKDYLFVWFRFTVSQYIFKKFKIPFFFNPKYFPSLSGLGGRLSKCNPILIKTYYIILFSFNHRLNTMYISFVTISHQTPKQSSTSKYKIN